MMQAQMPPITAHESRFPSTCVVPQLLYDLDAPAGRGIYVCTEPNVWTMQLGTMTVGGGGERPPSPQTPQWEINTFIFIFWWLSMLTYFLGGLLWRMRNAGRDAD